MRNEIEERKKRWERTPTYKELMRRINKGLPADLPIKIIGWHGPGYRERDIIFKIVRPMNKQVWEDLWELLDPLQEDVFGKVHKGRPRNKPHRIRGNTLQACIDRGKEIFGSLVDSSWRINFPDIPNKKISRERAVANKRIQKFICFSLCKTMGSNRALSRIFGVSKDTIKSWIAEVGTWTEEKKQGVIAQMNGFSDKDIYDAGERIPLRENTRPSDSNI